VPNLADLGVVAQASGGIRSQASIFEEIFLVFLALGTIVGIIVISYTLYNGYKYREEPGDSVDTDFEAPVVGELPTEEKSGKKLFLSFGLSAVIVISLIVYSYGLLLAVEDPAQDPDIEIEVQGFQFGWTYEYPSGQTRTGNMYVPEDSMVNLQITSIDVWHTFGVPELRVKADAIPGEYSHTWFTTPATDAGDEVEYDVECFELCGTGHSIMVGSITVLDEDEWNEWYDAENATSDNMIPEGDS
jgi:cytochrome c oxidase subunit 2